MSDKESKTEEPTARRIEKALEEGNVPISRDAITLGSLAGLCLIIIFAVTPAIINIYNLLKENMLQITEQYLDNSSNVTNILFKLFIHIIIYLAPILTIIIVSNLAASILQSSPRFVLKRIKPQFSRVSLAKGFNKFFSKSHLIEFIKTFIKFLGCLYLVYLSFFKDKMLFYNIFLLNPASVLTWLKSYVTRFLTYLLFAFTVIATFDIFWTRLKWHKDLRMTRHEVKEEFKQSEGDPAVRSKMRSLTRSRIQRNMLKNVPDATVVITNPTHYAVALRYKPPKDPAPIVLAKGQNLIALQIKEIAQKHNIEIVENVELARALYKKVEINQLISEDFYHAVAEIIRYINQTRR